MANRAVIIAARRTPLAAEGHHLAQVGESSLLAPVLRALAAEVHRFAASAGLQDPAIAEVVAGCCCDPGGDIARIAVLEAGLGAQVPGVTVDRQCGSGLDAIRLGASLINELANGRDGPLTGGAPIRLVLAGGVESASRAGGMAGRARFSPVGHADPDMGPAADRVAAMCGISRARQDAYALRSHERARRAAAGGVFDAELVPVAGVEIDDALRRTVTAQVLARMRPVFGPTGTVTGGNTCGVYDGAAAVALVPETVRRALGVPGLTVLATAVVGVDPELPALGAAPAIRLALDRAGVELAEVDVLELTEAFAAQVLACTDQLGWDALGPDGERVCPDGGAIALGHPWGASGALLAVRLFSRLIRQSRPGSPGGPRSGRPPRIGVAACAIGGGQGIAVVVERTG